MNILVPKADQSVLNTKIDALVDRVFTAYLEEVEYNL